MIAVDLIIRSVQPVPTVCSYYCYGINEQKAVIQILTDVFLELYHTRTLLPLIFMYYI
jgi:hypothetical protein